MSSFVTTDGRGNVTLAAYSHAGEGTSAKTSTDPRLTSRVPPPRRALSIQEAKEWAADAVKRLGRGSQFTSMRLFEGVRLRRDKRARGEVIRSLQRAGIITLAGFTRDDQEGRNNGYAALWEVV